MFGKARAQMVALNMEYDWKPDSNYARASFADLHIRRVFGTGLQLSVPQGAQARVQNTEGDRNIWEVKWQVQGETAAADLQNTISSRLTASQWNKQESGSKDATKSVWKFSDENGGAWNGTTTVQGAGEKTFAVSLKVERSGVATAKPISNPSAAAEKIVIRDAWIQEMPPARKLTAAYMVIENNSAQEITLVAGKTEIAGAVELHQMFMEGNMMRMRKIERIKLPVGRTELTGNFHIMLIYLKSPVRVGDEVALTLEFENAPSKTLMVPVKKRQER
jgi:copper(I)-binding protein